MDDPTRPEIYRDLIDRLVHQCSEGQGQIRAQRVRAGVWNASASATFLPDQYAINLLLTRMTQADRETLARMLSDAFLGGLMTTLDALHEAQIEPFEDGYEGSPSHDFIGRLTDWSWPES
jgi:hypothetical protein